MLDARDRGLVAAAANAIRTSTARQAFKFVLRRQLLTTLRQTITRAKPPRRLLRIKFLEKLFVLADHCVFPVPSDSPHRLAVKYP